MLSNIGHEEYLMKFNKFPKTKYVLYINNSPYYQFVTTSKSEEECINILKEMVDNISYATRAGYKVFSIVNGIKNELFKGKTKCYADL